MQECTAHALERPAECAVLCCALQWETNHIVMKAAYAPSEPGFSIEITFRTDRRSVSTEWPADVAAAAIAAVDAETGGTGSRLAGVRNAPAAVSA